MHDAQGQYFADSMQAASISASILSDYLLKSFLKNSYSDHSVVAIMKDFVCDLWYI